MDNRRKRVDRFMPIITILSLTDKTELTNLPTPGPVNNKKFVYMELIISHAREQATLFPFENIHHCYQPYKYDGKHCSPVEMSCSPQRRNLAVEPKEEREYPKKNNCIVILYAPVSKGTKNKSNVVSLGYCEAIVF
ncbi:hypothetical protein CEXT_221471 [Caerostris extrusa]|uniref:Uncharacterized protein n=1 Tax=Caerostris extrusa TaxID=172846 RepID=A0AAV4PYW7_CAEEX|nr:hypothetical protein CEXT_221471 [Caerostris extrusa]